MSYSSPGTVLYNSWSYHLILSKETVFVISGGPDILNYFLAL